MDMGWMFQGEEKDLGVASMGSGVLEAGETLKASKACFEVWGVQSWPGARRVWGLCEPELVWGSPFPPQRGWGCIGRRKQQLGLGGGSQCQRML